jgi:hypothetical protein
MHKYHKYVCIECGYETVYPELIAFHSFHFSPKKIMKKEISEEEFLRLYKKPT